MPKQEYVKVTRPKKPGVKPFVIAILAAAVFSLVIAVVWQLTAPAVAETVQPFIDPSLLSGPISQPSADSATSPGASAAEPFAEISDGSAFAPPPLSMSGFGLVGPQERVSSTYFDDAVFVGDSITTGIKFYDIMSNTTVLAGTGIGLNNILTNEFINDGDKKITILQALEIEKPKKIYLMLGANSLRAGTDWAIGRYAKVVDAIMQQHPDSILYLQSVLPINEPIFEQRYDQEITNAIIDEFNLALCDMAEQKGIYYLDVNSIFRDSDGGMPAEYTPDGLHIKSAQYTSWFDYLKMHAIS